MSKINLRGDAIAAYEAATAAPDGANWRTIAELLRAALPTAKAKAENGWADYPITRYKTDRVGPTCVVRFADGEVTRMSTACLPGKPLNAGRGIRLAVAAWQSRHRPAPAPHAGIVSSYTPDDMPCAKADDAACDARPDAPPIAACHFERDGEVIASYEADECNARKNAIKTEP